MNYAALLALAAATAFALPLLTQIAESLGVPRPVGAGVTLAVAAVAAAILIRCCRRQSAAPTEDARAGL